MKISLTPSQIIEYLYCPRFTYFEYVLRIPQYEDRHFKVSKGREVHQQKARQNTAYLRHKIGVKRKWMNQYMTNGHLRGEVDEVLLLNDDTMAPLDYKFARYEGKLYDTYKRQIYCYAWLIEDNFKCKVNKGYIVYTRSKNKLIEVPVKSSDIDKVKKAVSEIQDILQNNKFPRSTKMKRRCITCTYRNICVK